MADESNTNFLRARRSLEIVSAVLFLITWFGIPPKSLPLLGDTLDAPQSRTLLWLFIAAWAYLFLRYWIAVRVRVTGDKADARGALALIASLYRKERKIAIFRYAEKVVRPESAQQYLTAPLKDSIQSISPRARDGTNVRLRRDDALVTFNVYFHNKPDSQRDFAIPLNWRTRPHIALRSVWRLVTLHDEVWEVCLPYVFGVAWIPCFIFEAAKNPSNWIIGLHQIQTLFNFLSGG